MKRRINLTRALGLCILTASVAGCSSREAAETYEGPRNILDFCAEVEKRVKEDLDQGYLAKERGEYQSEQDN